MNEADAIVFGLLTLTLLLVAFLMILASVRNGKNPCRNGINDGCGVRAMDEFCYGQHRQNGEFKDVCRRYCARVATNPDLVSEYCTDRNVRPDTYAILAAQHNLPVTRSLLMTYR